MIQTEPVLLGETVHTIETKPVTVVFNSAHKEVVYPERVSITSEMTLPHFDSLEEIDKYTACLFKIVVQDYSHPVTKRNIEQSISAFKHLVGLFSLSLQLMIEGKKIVWKYPEHCLHPRYQGNIADVMILLGNPKSFSKFIGFVAKGYFDEFILSAEGSGNTILKRLDELILTQTEID